MSRLLHITTPDAWARAKESGSYTADSLQTEGFIHCSEPRQVVWVANKHYRGKRGLLLLNIDPSKLNAEVRYENLEGGSDLFPHVYGAIPVEAVVDVTTFEPDDDGTFKAA